MASSPTPASSGRSSASSRASPPSAASDPGAGVDFGRFFLPGPTEVRPEILRAQVAPMIAHRGPHVRALMEEIQEGLRPLFGTDGPVLVSTSSATGLMEAAVRNGVRPGGRVLCLVNGAFGERFAKIARACDREVDVLEVPWGRRHDPAEVAARLAGADYDAVTVVHSETSTGALQPLEELAAVVADVPGALFLADSVTGVGGVPMEADRWGLDFVLTGSQKALALPPGLAFAVASDAMMERAGEVPDRGLYFDLLAFRRRIDAFQTPNTPAVSLLYALRAQLRAIAEEGVEARWERHRAMAERCREWVGGMRGGPDEWEVAVLADGSDRSPTVTCITLPEGVSGPAVVDALRDRGFVIGTGYGKLKETSIRIGHMGDHTVNELDAVLAALEEALVEVAGAQAPEAGPAGTNRGAS